MVRSFSDRGGFIPASPKSERPSFYSLLPGERGATRVFLLYPSWQTRRFSRSTRSGRKNGKTKLEPDVRFSRFVASPESTNAGCERRLTGHTTRQADGFVECRMLTRLSWWKWLCFLWSLHQQRRMKHGVLMTNGFFDPTVRMIALVVVVVAGSSAMVRGLFECRPWLLAPLAPDIPNRTCGMLCVSPMQALRFHTVSSGGPYHLPSVLKILLQHVRKRHGFRTGRPVVQHLGDMRSSSACEVAVDCSLRPNRVF